jgi:hypothetical protein
MLSSMSSKSADAANEKTYASFDEFWPDYVRAHKNKTNRRLHFVGSTLALACVGGAVLFRKRWLLLAAPIAGYGFAWVGHFVFEKNTPATFTHPLYSLRGDFVMWSKIARGTMDAEVARYAAETDERVEVANGANVDVTAN